MQEPSVTRRPRRKRRRDALRGREAAGAGEDMAGPFNTVRCEACLAEIPAAATTCPQCGHAQPEEPAPRRWLGRAVAASFLLAVIAAITLVWVRDIGPQGGGLPQCGSAQGEDGVRKAIAAAPTRAETGLAIVAISDAAQLGRSRDIVTCRATALLSSGASATVDYSFAWVKGEPGNYLIRAEIGTARMSE